VRQQLKHGGHAITPVLKGAGLGLRREHLDELSVAIPAEVEFFEVAPENWMELGGYRYKQWQQVIAQRPLVAHGLSLSLGSPAPLDEAFVQRVGRFLDEYNIVLYTEHLSWCSDAGHLYDLLPMPFTQEAVEHISARIKRVQEILQRRIAVENASFYVNADMSDMSENRFIREVLKSADCDLHLDVNNVYVNSVNFGFDPQQWLQHIPVERVVYMHTAGHYRETHDLIIDTHGEAVIEPVWALLQQAYHLFGVHPTLLERDFNIPPLAQLLPEVARIRQYQDEAHYAAVA
jgi:uncharacterized protein